MNTLRFSFANYFFKEWTMSSVLLEDDELRLKHLQRYLRALPTIRVHPELDGRTLDIVHCFYNICYGIS